MKIAKTFKTSDTHVLDVFDTYVKLEHLTLSDAICIDEVYIDMDPRCKYVMAIQDFHTGQTVDMLHSKKSNITEPYFASIPKEERFAVKYLISDVWRRSIENQKVLKEIVVGTVASAISETYTYLQQGRVRLLMVESPSVNGK